MKDTKFYVPVITLSAKVNQKLSKLLSKQFEISVYWNEYKTKTKTKQTNKQKKKKQKKRERIKIQQMKTDIFSHQILLLLIDCLY